MDLSWAPFAAMYAAFLIAVRNYNSKVLEIIKSREADVSSVRDLVSEFSAYCRMVCKEKFKLIRICCGQGEVLDGSDKEKILGKLDENYCKCILLKEKINSKAPDSIYKKNSLSVKVAEAEEGVLGALGQAARVASLFTVDSMDPKGKDEEPQGRGGSESPKDKFKSQDEEEAHSSIMDSFFKIIKLSFEFSKYVSAPVIVSSLGSDFELENIESDIISDQDRENLELAKKTLEDSLSKSLIECRGEHDRMFEVFDKERIERNKDFLEVQLIIMKRAAEEIFKIYDKGIKKVVKKHFVAELVLNVVGVAVIAFLYWLFEGFVF